MNFKLAVPNARPGTRLAPGVDLEIKLIVRYPGQPTRMITLGDEDYVLGRDLSCHLRVDHERVSPCHCRIRRLGGGRVLVEDLNSIYGTTVNGQEIRKAEVRDGDRLRVGPMLIGFRIAEAAADLRPRGDGDWLGNPLDLITTRDLGDAEPEGDAGSEASETARMILSRMARRRDADDSAPVVQIADASGIAVVRVLGKVIVEATDIRRIAEELKTLVEAGRARIALNLEPVEYLSHQAAEMMGEVRDQCWASGGLLKLCEVGPGVDEILAFLGVDDRFQVATNERTAVEGAWPQPRRVPPAPKASLPALERVRLVALLGQARGRVVEVEGPRFVIGRDPACHLRPNSPAISRLHTVLEHRDGRVFVRDLGATNGTRINGRLLRGAEMAVVDGDRLQVGPLLFALVVGDRNPAEVPRDDDAAWLIDDFTPDDAPQAPTVVMRADPAHGPGGPRSTRPAADIPILDLAYAVLGDVLRIDILPTALDDEEQVGPVRQELCALFERPLPRRVVLSLEHVERLSSYGVGVLLAHYQRLTRAGGALRLCHVHPHLTAILWRMRVPMLIEVFPTAEAALEEPWE